jgi:general secretion pathway protein F
MAQFSYRAVDSAGMLHTGEVTSVSRAVALESLSRRGLFPLSIDEGVLKAGGVRRPGWLEFGRFHYKRRAQVSPRELLGLTQSLAALLKAGLTIDRALQISASLAPRPASRLLAESLLQSVRSGKTLSASLTASEQRLPPYFVSMVDAGEMGGSLPETLNRLAELMSKQTQMRERIHSALVYPALLGGVVLVTLVVLLLFVLPRFEQLFSESEAPLPWSTQMVLGLGRLTADYWWAAILAITVIGAAFVTWLKSPPGRFQYDRWLLRTRLTLGLPAALDTARLLRTVGSLCKNGLPLSQALRIARGTVGNRYLLDALTGVTREVQAGEAFSVAFARAGCFPAVAVQLARVGEETGHLEELLQSAAGVLEEQAHRLLERLLSLVVPLLTIGMGLVVAGLIGSVLIGLLSINDLAF